MAAIDSLLRLLSSQNAEAISLRTDQVPRLTRGGEPLPLSMPPLGAALLQTFVRELLSQEQQEELRQSGDLSVEYGAFLVRVKAEGGSLAIMARPRPTGPARAAPATARAATAPATTPASPPTAPPATMPASTPIAPPATMPASPPIAPPALAVGREARPTEVPSGRAAEQLQRWLGQLLSAQGSDLIVTAGSGARARVAGGLMQLGGEPLEEDELLDLLLPLGSEAQRQAFHQHGATDLASSWPTAAAIEGSPYRSSSRVTGERQRFRVNLFRHSHGVAASFRPVRRQVASLEELRLPGSLTRLISYPHGLVLVTGPAGSGKSTTLTALIEHLNRTVQKHVITIEDPIEHEYLQGTCLIHQREVGTHVDSFEAGLRAALREAPDLILLGEMRDRATIAAALTAAETGHLVLSTLHAGHAAMAVERIVDVFPEYQQLQVRLQLAQSLRGILTQYLLPASDGSRYLPAIELLIASPAAGAMIREGKTHQLHSIIQTGREEGMIPLDRSLADRVSAGELSFDVAAAVTLDGGLQLRELLGRRGR